jgi:hypothetical protein
MIKRNNLFILLLLLCTGSFAKIEGYTYKRKLNTPPKEGYYSIPVLPEVWAHCKSNNRDIRLYNIHENDTTEVQYIAEWLGTKTEQKPVSFSVINDTYNDKSYSYITLKSNKKQTINQIVLNIDESNFDKNVMIEGSTDNQHWFTIREHLRIVRFNNSQDKFEYTTLDFQDAEYNYFRLKFDDTFAKRITVNNAYAYENTVTKGQYAELKPKPWKQTENKKDKTSEIIVEFPYQYMVNSITVKSNSTADFYRNINVYATYGTYHTATGGKDNWFLVNSSVFTSEKNYPINCNNEATFKLKIEVMNYDNAPIQINEIKVYAEQSKLVAYLPVSENIYLTYGKTNDHDPVYDIEHFKKKIPAALSEISYGDEQAKITKIEKASPLIESKKWLWVIMIIVILLIGYFALSMIRKEGK